MSDPNFSSECPSCLSGQDCERAYVSMDGTVYWCNRVLRAVTDD